MSYFSWKMGRSGNIRPEFSKTGDPWTGCVPRGHLPPSLPGVERFSLHLGSVSWSFSLHAQCLPHTGWCPVYVGYVGQRLLVPTPSRSSVCTLRRKGPCFPPARFQALSGGSKPCQNPGYLLAKAPLSWESVIPAGGSLSVVAIPTATSLSQQMEEKQCSSSNATSSAKCLQPS